MSLSSPSQQLTLPVQINQDMSFESFYGSVNQKSSSLLKVALEAQQETLIYISGPTGVGKTHLLCAAMNFIEPQTHSVCYFSMSDFSDEMSSEDEIQAFFATLSHYSLVILDNIDEWLAYPKHTSSLKELCLFNLFNEFKVNAQQLLVSSKIPPSYLPLSLKDLKSRLQSGLLLRLTSLNDVQKQALLKTIAKEKGFNLEDDVSAYIIKRSGRDLDSLVDILKTLDQASLIEQRKLTVPFAKKILNW